MADLCEFEIRVLRIISGEDAPNLQWGAAMGAALETLIHRKLVTDKPHCSITDAGRTELARRADAALRGAIALDRGAFPTWAGCGESTKADSQCIYVVCKQGGRCIYPGEGKCSLIERPGCGEKEDSGD